MAEARPDALFEMWRKQVEDSTQAWTRLLSREPPAATPPDPTVFWRPVLDQGIQAWSKILGQAMGTEQFAKLMGQSLDQVLVLQAPFRKAAEQHTEQALQALGLPSRNQVTGVAT